MRMPKSTATVKRQIEAKIRSLGEAGIFMSGSFIEKRWKCAKPDCICNRTGKKHTAYAVTSKVKGKTKSIYVPVAQAEEVKQWVLEHKRIQIFLKADITGDFTGAASFAYLYYQDELKFYVNFAEKLH